MVKVDIGGAPSADVRLGQTASVTVELPKTGGVVKLPLYTRAGIHEVWIVDLKSRVVDVHRAPRDGRYDAVTRVQAGGALSPDLAPEVRIPIAQVLG